MFPHLDSVAAVHALERSARLNRAAQRRLIHQTARLGAPTHSNRFRTVTLMLFSALAKSPTARRRPT